MLLYQIVIVVIQYFYSILSMHKQEATKQNGHQDSKGQTFSKNQDAILDLGPVSLPDGTSVSKNDYGFCYLAAKPFKKGDIIYTCEYVEVPMDVDKYKFSLDGVQYFCDHHNSVKFEETRCLYTCGSFINHCCQQNSYTIEIDGKQFQAACRDINPGEQITTNYFHYDYEGCFEFKCLCNSPKCFGHVNGFKNLSLENKIKVLNRTLPCVKQYWLNDQKNIVIVEDLKIPGELCLKNQGNCCKIYSKKAFSKGQQIFRIKNENSIKNDKTIIYKIQQEYYKWDSPREFLYFTTFLLNNPDPNCIIHIGANQIVGVCLKDIMQSDEICV